MALIVDGVPYLATRGSFSSEQAIRELVKGKAVVSIQDFTDVPLETCIKRDLQCAHSVGEAVIRRMYHQYLDVPASFFICLFLSGSSW